MRLKKKSDSRLVWDFYGEQENNVSLASCFINHGIWLKRIWKARKCISEPQSVYAIHGHTVGKLQNDRFNHITLCLASFLPPLFQTYFS